MLSASWKLITEAQYNEILGLTMIGPDVLNCCLSFQLAQQWDLTADEVARVDTRIRRCRRH